MNELIRKIQEQEERIKRIEGFLSLNKNVFNLEEVCAFTGKSRSFFYKKTARKEIPHYKQSKHLYFDRTEIENWLKSSRQTPVSEIQAAANQFTIQKKPGSK